MARVFTTVYLQPVAILATTEPREDFAPETVAADPARNYIKQDPNVRPVARVLPSSQILRTTFSSVPVISQSELGREYQELGEALGQMTELHAENEWGIDQPVHGAACFIAAELMSNSYPAPRIFTHGPKSVVFNWSRDSNNLYLTISANRISALLSSPERIKRRIEFQTNDLLNPGRLLAAIQSAHLEQPTSLRVNGAVPDPSEIVVG